MRRDGTVVLLVVAALLLCGCASMKLPSSAVHDFSMEELLGRMPPRDSLEARLVYFSMARMGQDGVAEICKNLGPPGTERKARAENALQGLALYVASKGSEEDRTMFVSALGKELEGHPAPEQASFLIARLQIAGRRESIGRLSRFLADERLCEPAAQAMMAIREGAERVS